MKKFEKLHIYSLIFWLQILNLYCPILEYYGQKNPKASKNGQRFKLFENSDITPKKEGKNILHADIFVSL